MNDVTESVDVNVPIRTAYDQWTRFEAFPWFMAGVESVSRIDDTHTHWVTEIAGIRREFDAEITEQRPDERIAWRSTGGEVGHVGAVTFESLDAERTRVTVHLAWEPTGLAEKAGSALGIDHHQIKADAHRFKKYIERPEAAAEVSKEGWPEPAADGQVPAGAVSTEDVPAPMAGTGPGVDTVSS